MFNRPSSAPEKPIKRGSIRRILGPFHRVQKTADRVQDRRSNNGGRRLQIHQSNVGSSRVSPIVLDDGDDGEKSERKTNRTDGAGPPNNFYQRNTTHTRLEQIATSPRQPTRRTALIKTTTKTKNNTTAEVRDAGRGTTKPQGHPGGMSTLHRVAKAPTVRRAQVTRVKADLTNDSDDGSPVYQEIGEDEARELVGLSPKKKIYVDFNEDADDEKDNGEKAY